MNKVYHTRIIHEFENDPDDKPDTYLETSYG